MTKQEEIIEKLARLEENNKSTNQRIEELQKITKAFYDLASDAKVEVARWSVVSGGR